jgi:pimeloyl-ACP methyl ester carboxylesterase
MRWSCGVSTPAPPEAVILLHGDGPVEAAAHHLQAFGLARVLPFGAHPGTSQPVMHGELSRSGNLRLVGLSGRFGRGSLHGTTNSYTARDGQALPYFHHACDAGAVAIVLHGASAHGDRYAVLGAWLRHQGLAETYAPTLRGHHGAGPPGDVAYRDQLLHDLEDLVADVKQRSPGKRLVLIAHSVAGGLALRYAARANDLAGLVLFAPYLGLGAPTERRSTGRGWVRVHALRAAALAAVEALGLHAWQHLPILGFHPPAALCDGTETRRYSYRLARAFEPAGVPRCPTLVLAGTADEVFEASAYPRVFPDAVLIPGASHLGVVFHPEAHARISAWWP